MALGRMSELGYSMIFGEVKKEFFFKNVKGRGYADTGKGVITEFYSPVVPKGYDLLREIKKINSSNNVATSLTELGKHDILMPKEE